MRGYLKQLRKNKDFTQQDLETRSGIKANYYCMIENGERQKDMSLSVMKKLAKAFEVSVEEIMRMETDYKAAKPAREDSGKGAERARTRKLNAVKQEEDDMSRAASIYGSGYTVMSIHNMIPSYATPPCRDCLDKHEGCHAGCVRYNDYKAEHGRIAEKARREQELASSTLLSKRRTI